MRTDKAGAASRREFLQTSTIAAAGASLLGSLSVARGAHVSADDTIKIGLIGCGGRGTGAATQTRWGPTRTSSWWRWAMPFPTGSKQSLPNAPAQCPQSAGQGRCSARSPLHRLRRL